MSQNLSPAARLDLADTLAAMMAAQFRAQHGDPPPATLTAIIRDADEEVALWMEGAPSSWIR